MASKRNKYHHGEAEENESKIVASKNKEDEGKQWVQYNKRYNVGYLVKLPFLKSSYTVHFFKYKIDQLKLWIKHIQQT